MAGGGGGGGGGVLKVSTSINSGTKMYISTGGTPAHDDYRATL